MNAKKIVPFYIKPSIKPIQEGALLKTKQPLMGTYEENKIEQSPLSSKPWEAAIYPDEIVVFLENSYFTGDKEKKVYYRLHLLAHVYELENGMSIKQPYMKNIWVTILQENKNWWNGQIRKEQKNILQERIKEYFEMVANINKNDNVKQELQNSTRRTNYEHKRS